MLAGFGRLRKGLFGIPLEEIRAGRRGFEAARPAVRERLESIGEVFVGGYHAALLDNDPGSLAASLDSVASELRGFAFEGAAMGLALSDMLAPWRSSRWAAFAAGPARIHAYMVHVGAGWMLARLRRRPETALARMDPLLRWLAMDGYGFHEGYFHARECIDRKRVPRRLAGYARRAFDHGLGRSLWFVKGADAERIAHVIAGFSANRQADLWSGIGLACAYAGGVDRAALGCLRASAVERLPQLAQGAAFAAKARERAGNPAAHTELACEVLCGMPAREAAAITDAALQDLPPDGADPAYETWRRRIQDRFAGNEPRGFIRSPNFVTDAEP